MTSALSRFPEIIARYFTDDQEVILAGVSGGSDSIALLHLLARFLPRAKERLHVVHVNHGLRIKDSNLDEEHTQAHCTALGLLCLVYQRPVADMARRRKISLEEAGREARHECFLDAARTFKAKAVVLAHHLDDRAETLLLNLIRGAAGQGLSALHYVRPFPHPLAPEGLRLVRPLLGITKQELETYLIRSELSWRQDQTNHDEAFTRNRIRASLLPLLEREFTPQIKLLLARSAEILGRDDALLAEMADREWSGAVVEESHGRAVLSCRRLLALHPSLLWRILARAWDRLGIPHKSSVHLDHLQALAAGRASAFSLPGGWRASRSKDLLVLSRSGRGQAAPGYAVSLDRPVCTNPGLPYGVQKEILTKTQRQFPRQGGDTVRMDADKAGDLILRNSRPGDFIRLLGMGGKRKAVRKVLSEMKLTSQEKALWPLVAGEREVFWIFKGPVSESVKITPETRRILQIKIFKLP